MFLVTFGNFLHLGDDCVFGGCFLVESQGCCVAAPFCSCCPSWWMRESTHLDPWISHHSRAVRLVNRTNWPLRVGYVGYIKTGAPQVM